MPLRLLQSDEACRVAIQQVRDRDTLEIYLEGCLLFEPSMVMLGAYFRRDIYLDDLHAMFIYNDEIDLARILDS